MDTPVYIQHNNKNMIHSNIVARTRKYKCPNNKCETQKKPELKEAIFFRAGSTHKLTYICVVCKTEF